MEAGEEESIVSSAFACCLRSMVDRRSGSLVSFQSRIMVFDRRTLRCLVVGLIIGSSYFLTRRTKTLIHIEKFIV